MISGLYTPNTSDLQERFCVVCIPELGKLLVRLELILCAGWCDDPAAVLGLLDICALVVVRCGDSLLCVGDVW